jgi:flagellar motility protein MotE (MotC chaperone)
VLSLVITVALTLFTRHQQTDDGSLTESERALDSVADSAVASETPADVPLLDENDPMVLEAVMQNLAFLDYEPEISEVEAEEIGMSIDDSIEAEKWLQAEKAALLEREKELTRRERELAKLDERVTTKLLKLEKAQSTRITGLAMLYNGMDPSSVATLMANLDDEMVVSILPRMNPKNASAVLSLMPAKRAAQLSKRMITIAEN